MPKKYICNSLTTFIYMHIMQKNIYKHQKIKEKGERMKKIMQISKVY